jgi:DNA-binding transcriptional ArsR family regulator
MHGSLAFPPLEQLDVVDVLQALADPVRLQIVRLLDDADAPVACADMHLPVVKSTASHHLKVLREAGIVWAEEEGTRRYYALRRNDLEARFPGLLAAVLSGD